MKIVFDIPLTVVDFEEFFNVVSEPANRATILTFKYTIKFIEAEKFRSGSTSLVLLEENYKMLPSGIIFKTFSPYFEIYNEMLAWLESNGLMEHWRRKFQFYSSSLPEDIGPQVLTMDHLRVGFLACLIPLFLSVIVFIGELIYQDFHYVSEFI